MSSAIKYIELKSGYEDNGPAWIGQVQLSKSGCTVYFNWKAFKVSNKGGIKDNYFGLETGEEYWISGIKNDMTDWHWTGNGKIYIDSQNCKWVLEISKNRKTWFWSIWNSRN